MKRILSLILVLALAALGMPALASVGDATLYRAGEGENQPQSVERVALHQNMVYVQDYENTLYARSASGEGDWTQYAYTADETLEQGMRVSPYALFSDGETLYTLMVAQFNDDETSRIEGAYLARVALENGEVTYEKTVDLDWTDMVESYDNYEYSRNCMCPFVLNGKLFFTTYAYSASGQDLFSFDMETGESATHAIENLRSACPYKDGQILAAAFNYDSEARIYELSSYDPDAEELTPLAKMELPGYYLPGGLVYSAEKDTLYYVLDGQLFAAPGVDLSKKNAVAAVSQENTDNMPMLTDDGFYICYDYSTIIKRNTDPNARAETRLSVVNNYTTPVQNAYYTFTSVHPEVEVALRNYQSDIITSMMNRSSDIDIYVLSVNSQEYGALFERGYMAELTGSEELSSFVKDMYPNLTDMIIKDGEVLALPVSMDTYTNSVNLQALEALGLASEDIPTSWPQYLALLTRLPALLENAQDIYAFEPYYAAPDLRSQMLHAMIRDYTLYMMKTDGAEMSFDTQIMRDMLAALEKVDFVALGLQESNDEENRMAYNYDPQKILFQDYYSVSAHSNWYRSGTVMPLSVADGITPMIPTGMEVVFVNPFSANRELAIEYLEYIVRELEPIERIHFSPAYSEPIRNSYYETTLEIYQEVIDQYTEQMNAADDSEKAYYEEMIKEYEGYKAEFAEHGSWTASAESIAEYQKNVRMCAVSENLGLDGDNSQAFYANIEQYLTGEINAETMLKNIDKKLKMMLMEGN